MNKNWYKLAKDVLALRKHVMRVDLHTHVGEATDYRNPNDLDSALKALITSAIFKGLDVLGVVAHSGPSVGWRGLELVKQNNYDLVVIPGQEYVSLDKYRILVYKLQEPMPDNLNIDDAIAYAHNKGGFVMALNVTKRQAQKYNSQNNKNIAPDAIEIYNGAVGGYQDIDVNYPKFISSAAKSSNELEKANVFTAINREILTRLKLIVENEGIDYTPNFLKPKNTDTLPSAANPINQGPNYANTQ